MFPSGTAGVGLLVLRFSVMASLMFDGCPYRSNAAPSWILVALGTTALLLCLGLFTPICSVLCAVLEAFCLLRMGGRYQFHPILDLMTCIILALLGPGAYSIDSMLFGRRRLMLPPRR
jgi:hypothetical protein